MDLWPRLAVWGPSYETQALNLFGTSLKVPPGTWQKQIQILSGEGILFQTPTKYDYIQIKYFS